MVTVKIDSKGRILIPHKQRKMLGLKPQTEFDLSTEDGILLLKPISKPLRVEFRKSKWESEAFPDSGDVTFGE